jgi:hypothetical protein
MIILTQVRIIIGGRLLFCIIPLELTLDNGRDLVALPRGSDLLLITRQGNHDHQKNHHTAGDDRRHTRFAILLVHEHLLNKELSMLVFFVK